MRCAEAAPPDGPSITLAILTAFGVPLIGLLAGALGGKSFLFQTLSEDARAVIGGAAGLAGGLLVGGCLHRLASAGGHTGPWVDPRACRHTPDATKGP